MKLTKRQLKRIIREEYSLLKRRGLIKESYGSFTDEQLHLFEEIWSYVFDNEDMGEPLGFDDTLDGFVATTAADENTVANAMETLIDSGIISSNSQGLLVPMVVDWQYALEQILDEL